MNEARKLAAETLGSAFLLATVVGSGIMAEQLSGGNIAIALLGNTIATGAILYVLVTMLGPVSGAHFNPAVTLAALLRGEIGPRLSVSYLACQVIGAALGVFIAHAMFDLTLLQAATKMRAGPAQLLSEAVATFGLLTVIFTSLRTSPHSVAANVALFITAAYWFTASTSFANPAVTIARSLTDTFSGIRPGDVPGFVAAQFAGAGLAVAFDRWFRVQT